jgi:hypothetical protein
MTQRTNITAEVLKDTGKWGCIQRTGPAWGVATSGRVEEVGKLYGWVNRVQTLCTPICKWKNGTC